MTYTIAISFFIDRQSLTLHILPMDKLKLGFSPCPNDTFIFHAMTHGLVDTGRYAFDTVITDVEELNRMAVNSVTDITKLSFHAYLKLKEHYSLLASGSALGYGCGPLVVSKGHIIGKNSLIAVPGELTTACLLLKLWMPGAYNLVFTRFDNIIPGVASGEFDAGVIIHEGRFIYGQHNLEKVIDLGEWWETETGSPIPLGCIAVKKTLGETVKHDAESIIRSSVEFAFRHRDASREFIKSHAQEMDDEVINSHIGLYVNDFTVALGEKGMRAVETLEFMARQRGIIA